MTFVVHEDNTGKVEGALLAYRIGGLPDGRTVLIAARNAETWEVIEDNKPSTYFQTFEAALESL